MGFEAGPAGAWRQDLGLNCFWEHEIDVAVLEEALVADVLLAVHEGEDVALGMTPSFLGILRVKWAEVEAIRMIRMPIQ